MSKPWQSAVKRIKVTKNKKLLKKRTGQNHFNTKESGTTVASKRRKITAPRMTKEIFRGI